MSADHLAIKTYNSKYPRDQVKEIFLELSAYKNKKIFPVFMKYQKLNQNSSEPPEGFEQEIQLIEAQSDDFIYQKYGVELSDIRLELIYHKIDQDTDLDQLL